MRFLPLLPVMLALAACHSQPAPADAPGTSKAASLPTVAEARVVLPAVKGSPAAAYFTLIAGPATIINRVSVEGAGMAMMHETKGSEMAELKSLTLKPGEKVAFAPGGKHVMLFDLDPKLAPGGMAELSVWFADGSRAIAKARIEAAGGDMGGMEMEHHH